MKSESFDSVWDAICDTPEEAMLMTLCSELMVAVNGMVNGWKTTRANAAAKLGVTLPRLDELRRNRIDKFSFEDLLTLACRAGLQVNVEISPRAKSAMAAHPSRRRYAPPQDEVS